MNDKFFKFRAKTIKERMARANSMVLCRPSGQLYYDGWFKYHRALRQFNEFWFGLPTCGMNHRGYYNHINYMKPSSKVQYRIMRVRANDYFGETHYGSLLRKLQITSDF